MTELIASLEQDVRSGRLNEAREKINAVSFADVPRIHAAKMANLGLRAGALFWSVRLLNPIVRSDSAGISASVEEKAEYAFALNRIGAHGEAERILTELSSQPLPKIQLYLAAVHTNAWNYRSAIQCFEKYLTYELTPYEKHIGHLNLASCLIGAEADLDRAFDLLAQLRRDLNPVEHKLLYGNTYELSAQLAYKRGDDPAEWIAKGREIFPDVNSIYSLFFKKWETLSVIKAGGDARELLKPVRADAIRLQHHETIRECDYYEAIATGDQTLFQRVYFGTPWEKYRERLLKHGTPAETYDYVPNGDGALVLSLSPEVAKAGDQELKSGQILHRLLMALMSDFYRPMWVAAVFTHLFPDEFYHPETGPKRVHQAMFRLRKWLSDSNVPLAIEDSNGRYVLQWTQGCRIRLTGEKGTLKAEDVLCRKLAANFAGDFGAQEAATFLGVSPTSARQALKWGVDNNRLEKIGSGPKTRYRKSA